MSPGSLNSKKPGPQGQVRDQWLCPYKSTGVMEYWSVGLKKRALDFQIFSRDPFSESDEKRGFFHYSTTPILQYSASRQMPVN
jgi:hypothetical protein